MNFKKTWKRLFSLSRANGGFTLVELIVVIAILAILGGVAVPAYSGYVEKAKLAGDEQLLAAVNTAFAAACAENGTDTYNVAGDPYVDVETVKLTKPEAYVPAFDRYFAGNEDAEFKIFEYISFDEALGMFTGGQLSEAYHKILDMLTGEANQANIEALMDSVFGSQIGIDGLMGKVDFVSTLASELLKANPNGTLAELILGKENDMYGQILAESLGIDMSAEGALETYMQTVNGLMTQKMELLKAQNPEKYADASMEVNSELWKEAYYQIATNNAVLNAAKYSDAQKDTIMGILGGDNATSTLVQNINKSSSDGLSQAAMAYGMYTAYAARENITVSENPADVLLQLDQDQGFKDYINNTGKYANGEAQADLDGYLGSMNMINNAQKNSTAVEDVLVNGFANDELIGVLQQATNKS